MGLKDSKCFEICDSNKERDYDGSSKVVSPTDYPPAGSLMMDGGDPIDTDELQPRLEQQSATAASEQTTYSVKSSPREAGGQVSGALGLASKVLKLDPVSPEQWEKVLASIKDDPIGAYLIYSPINNGTWQCVWSRTYREDAWAYTRPGKGVTIPGYKFNSRPETFVTGIHTSSSALCTGWLEFIKLARRNRGSFIILPEFVNSQHKDLTSSSVVITFHHDATQLVNQVKPGIDFIQNLEDYDAVGITAGRRGATAISDMLSGQKILPATFATRAAAHGQGLVFLSL